MQDQSLAEKVWNATEREDVSWSVLVVGEDHVGEMQRLSFNLTDSEQSLAGDGRFISCGHAYWGVGPTISWHRACQDPSYLVGRRSAESFAPRWNELCADGAGDLPTTFVSLGPGTGEKDLAVLETLERVTEEPCYIPVDMSAEMLRLLLESYGGADASLRHMIAVKLDFSVPSNISALRTFLSSVVGDDTPILFSLVGNTLANFDDDLNMLKSLVDNLLIHDEDLLLLELATSPEIDESAAKMAEKEYSGSPLFKTWVTSALTTHTDLAVDPEAVTFIRSTEKDRALVLKVVYENTSKSSQKVTLADGSQFAFPSGDTIRLELTRKYHPDAVAGLLAQASLAVRARHRTKLSKNRFSGKFGLELLLVSRDVNANPSAEPSYVPFKFFKEPNG